MHNAPKNAARALPYPFGGKPLPDLLTSALSHMCRYPAFRASIVCYMKFCTLNINHFVPFVKMFL